MAPGGPTLPAGLVTFVFTDIEDSTRLMHRLGKDYAAALETHRRILREVMSAHGGREVKSEGDGFLFAFEDSIEALTACAEGQQSLSREVWPRGSIVRVRMGLHADQATPTADGDYVALGLHLAARVVAAAHGGQVLSSWSTIERCVSNLPPEVTARSLGWFRLKGFEEPVGLMQLIHPALDATFPPPKADPVVAHHLPAWRTDFVGRGEQLIRLESLLAVERLLTIVGPAGVGKTRTAVEVIRRTSRRAPAASWFVSLAAIASSGFVAQTVASAVGATTVEDGTPESALVSWIGERDVLLVIDNCEHVLEETASLVDRMLNACRGVRFLTTSREPLHVEGEQLFRLPPFPAPADTDDLAVAEPVRLFYDRARKADASFEPDSATDLVVAEICRRLDGLPLAIEIAASNVGTLGLSTIADRAGLALARGKPNAAVDRHVTMRATIESSYSLLSPGERSLFRALAVFAGGFTIGTAGRVSGLSEAESLDGIGSLLDKSLLHRTDDDRFAMLTVIRDFGLDSLRSEEEAEEVAERHLAWCAELVQAAQPQLHIGGNREAVALVDREYENIRSGLSRGLAEGRNSEDLLRLCGSLLRYWRIRGLYREGAEWCAQILARDGGSPGARAKVLNASGYLAWRLGDYAKNLEDQQLALALFREAGDERGVIECLINLAIVHGQANGDLDSARALVDEAITRAEAVKDDGLLGFAHNALAEACRLAGALDEARLLNLRAVESYRRAGDEIAVLSASGNIGLIAAEAGDRDAGSLLRQIFRTSLELDYRYIFPAGFAGLARVAFNEGMIEQAARLLGASDGVRGSLGIQLDPADAMYRNRLVQDLETTLGRHALQALIEEGSQLSPEAILEDVGIRPGKATDR